jgi:hypothetical protein
MRKVNFEDLERGDTFQTVVGTEVSNVKFTVTRSAWGTVDTVSNIGTSYSFLNVTGREYWLCESPTDELKVEGQWVKRDFKHIKIGDKFKIGSTNTIWICTKVSVSNHIYAVNTTSNQEHRFKGDGAYYLIFEQQEQSQNIQPQKAFKPTKDKWSLLRTVFGCEEEPPKEIPDYPHECPYCKSPAYIGGGLNIDCKGNCIRSQR